MAHFALPYLASYLLQVLYGLVDLFLVGRFAGVADTTAVAIGSQLTHIFTVLTTALAMGSTVLTGRATGGGDKEKVKKVIIGSIYLFSLFTIIATALLLILARPIASLMLTPPEAMEKTVSYTSICFAFSAAIVSYNLIASILRGMGDSKSPLLFVVVSSIANIVFDCILIGFLHLGATGAAIGTAAAQTLSVIVALAFVRRRRTLPRLSKADLIPERKILISLLSIGIPVALQDCFIQASFLAITAIANARGLQDAAAVGIVEKVISVMFIIPSSMLSTVSVMSSQCIGAGNTLRARSTLHLGVLISITIGSFISIVTVLFARQIVSLFTTDYLVAIRGGEYLTSYVFDCILAGVHFCFSGYFCALSLSILSFAHNAASVILVRIPLAYFLSHSFPETLFPMGLAPPLGSALSVLICITAYILITRKKDTFPFKR